MSAFLAFVEFLVAISVGVAAVSSYLIINKLWSRKAMKEVTESISIWAALLGLATSFPFLVKFALIDDDIPSALKFGVSIAQGLVFISVGAGIWVTENRDVGFPTLFLRALRTERRESADLVKALVQPKGVRELMAVFRAMAEVDKHVDERELKMMRQFAKRWRVSMPELEVGAVEGAGHVMHLRDSVAEYLTVSPPPEQATELLDVLQIFVQADEQVTREEELVMEEITGMVADYASDESGVGVSMHEVVIVPQSSAQTDAVRSLLPGVEPKTVSGGSVYSVGRFFSRRYADVVSQKYIDLGVFTTTVEA